MLAAYTSHSAGEVCPWPNSSRAAKIKGRTIAELGNMNTPLDMIVYQKDGKDYLLLANDRRGVMKIPTEGIDQVESIATRIKDIRPD